VPNEDGRTGRSAAWGIAAGVFCACAIATWQVAVAPKSTFPIVPTYVFAVAAVLALYMCFATIWGWWPTGQSVRGPSTARVATRSAHDGQEAAGATGEPAASAGAGGSAATALASSTPVSIKLKPELDTGTNRFRLGALNRGDLGSFRAEVTDAHNQDGNWIGRRSWPVPWLDDGSVGAKQIPKFGKPLLDFARFDFLGLQRDLEGTKWLRGEHWVFPSLPDPVKVSYSAVRYWSELNDQHFVITVRVIRDDPPGHIDTRFKIGTDGTQPYCRELPETPAPVPPVPTDPHRLHAPAVDGRPQQPAAEPEPAPASEPTITDRWHHTSDGGKVPALMRLTHIGMSHPGYGGRQSQETPPSVKIGMLVACQPIDPASSGTELRARFLAFLNSPAVRAAVEALTTIEPGMSWKNLAGHGPRTLEAALTASQDVLAGVPVASALFLPPTAGESLYGRDGRAATLILYVEPRTADGQIPPASDLATWSRRFSLALSLPGAFAEFLDDGIGLVTSNEPPAQLGVWLQSYQPLTVMVDIGGLHMLQGSSPSNQFIGWAFATADGKSPAGAARDLIVQLCEYTLHLDDFERALASESLQDGSAATLTRDLQ